MNPPTKTQPAVRRWLRLLSAFFILHSALAFCALGAQDAQDTFRIVCVNIRVPLQRDYDTGNGWNQRREICRDVLLAQNADIYTFQECRAEQLDFIKQAMPGFEDFAILNSPRADYPPSPTIAILYSTKRFKKRAGGGFWLSDTPEKPATHFEGAAFSRMVNWVLLQDQKTGRELLVWNTHLDEKGGAIGDALREKQTKVILDFAAKVPPGLPHVFTGDMNTIASSKAMRAITAAGWTDTWTALHGPDDPGRTYHAFIGDKNTKPGGKIDFIFCNNQLKPTASKIIRDNRAGRYPSDHYFVSADLEYAPPPKTP